MDQEKYRHSYPELKKQGDLRRVLHEQLSTIGSRLKADRQMSEDICYIRGKTRDVLIGTEWGRRCFYLSCSRKNEEGVATGSTDSLSSLAQAVHQLVELDRDAEDVQQEFSWLKIPRNSANPLQNPADAVQQAWEELEQFTRQQRAFAPLHPLILLARQHPKLGALFPFTSMFSLQFSQCTEYPFDCPCPGIWAQEAPEGVDNYRIIGGKPEMDFGDDYHAALDFVVSQLPADFGPARLGSADDDDED